MANNIDIFINGKDKTGDAFKSVNSGLANMGDHVSRTTGKVSAFTVAIGTVMGNAITGGLSKLTAMTSKLISTGIEFDSLRQQSEIAFTTMLGSGEKARAFLDDLQDFAATTPFEFPDLISASQRLLAMGFAADKVRPTLTAVGDAVAGLGGSSEMVDRVTTALGQMQAKGKASGEEMMQLTEAGIPAWEFLARKIGVSIPEAMEMVTKGAVSADIAIGALVDGMNSKFGGLMEAQSKSWAGLWSTIRDTYSQVSGKVMLPFFNLATEGLSRIVSFTSSPFFNAWVGELAEGAQRAADWIANLIGRVSDLFANMRDGLSFTGNLKLALHSLFGESLAGMLGNVIDLFGDIWLVARSFFRDVTVFEDEAPLVAWLVSIGERIREFAALISGEFARGLSTGHGLIGGLMEVLDNFLPDSVIERIFQFGDAIRATVATISHALKFDELVSSVEFGISASMAAVVDGLVDFVLRVYDTGKSIYDAVMSIVGVFVHLGRYGELMSTSEFGLNGALATIADNVISAFFTIYDAATSVYEIFRLLVTGDFRGGIFGLKEDDPIIGALFGIRGALITVGNFVINELPHWRTRWKDWATAAWEWVVEAARKLPEKISEWWAALIAWYDQHKEPFVTKLGEWANAAWQWIVNAAQVVGAHLSDWYIALSTWLGQNLPIFVAKLGDWAAAAWQWIVDAAGVVGAYLSDWYIAISTWLTQNLPILTKKLEEWSAAFGAMLANAAKKVEVEGQPVLEWFRKKFPDTTKTSIQAMEDVTKAWDRMWAAMRGTQQVAETETRSWVDRINGFIERHGATLLEIIDRDWALAVEIVSNAMEVMMGWIEVFMRLIARDWDGAWEAIVNVFKTKWDTIKAIFETAWVNLKAVFGIGMEEINLAIPGKVQEWIDKLTSPWVAIYDTFKNFGTNAGQGLIDGINGMIQAAQAKVTELGNLAVEAMGISIDAQSPSRKFMRLGEYSGEGYLIGLERKLSNLGATMNDLTRGGVGAGVTNNNTSSVMFNVNVQSTGDAVRDIRNQIELYRMAYGGYA